MRRRIEVESGGRAAMEVGHLGGVEVRWSYWVPPVFTGGGVGRPQGSSFNSGCSSVLFDRCGKRLGCPGSVGE